MKFSTRDLLGLLVEETHANCPTARRSGTISRTCVDGFQQGAHPILERTAVLIPADIELRGEEGVEEEVVGAVEFHELEAGREGACGGLRELRFDLCDLLAAEGGGEAAAVGRRHGGGTHAEAGDLHGRLRPSMHQLNPGHRALGPDGPGQTGEAGFVLLREGAEAAFPHLTSRRRRRWPPR